MHSKQPSCCLWLDGRGRGHPHQERPEKEKPQTWKCCKHNLKVGGLLQPANYRGCSHARQETQQEQVGHKPRIIREDYFPPDIQCPTDPPLWSSAVPCNTWSSFHNSSSITRTKNKNKNNKSSLQFNKAAAIKSNFRCVSAGRLKGLHVSCFHYDAADYNTALRHSVRRKQAAIITKATFSLFKRNGSNGSQASEN